ncbi:ABC transporter substrate-binding protein [Mameliella alba]|uniref:Bacterial extracellular solute-binding protein, family 5 n=1 Tax=Mameliella alba TaxID=561184 RepID=A0A0B3RS69_9RHOB|nr:ABC transporter substrate-binding protein [Mameliella alba]KHQ50787.1 Bacterial extracellular solute-binding protein, family 5 [Mameliella alba]
MKKTTLTATALSFGVLALGTVAQPVAAQTLTAGFASEPSSVDPLYHNLGPNNATRKHMFEALVGEDANLGIVPELAESWETSDDGLTWTFHLREGVKFHDGGDFTARDFLYTACRIPNVPNSPSSMAGFIKSAETITAPDDMTIEVTTAVPYPLLLTDFASFGVVSASANGHDGPVEYTKDGCPGIDSYLDSNAYNDGTATIGTGPYKFVSFTPGESIVVARNDDYWGDAPYWEQITIRPITNAGARVAALLAGDVDVIEKPPVQDLERLRNDPKVNVVQGASSRVIYLHFDHVGEPSPGIEGTDGKNPMKDLRVRKAISLAINRPLIVDRIMGGLAVPARQLVPDFMRGTDPEIALEDPDLEEAKRLLAEAGYPDGFKLVIGTPNDRYINDSKIAQAVAQMLTRAGIQTEVDAMTASVFFSRRNNYEFSLYLAGWGASGAGMASPLRALVASQDKDKGLGGTNRGRYSNPDLDAIIEEALSTVETAKHDELLRQASRIVVDDMAILPLHFEVTPWALRAGLTMDPRADQHTVLTTVRPE